MSESEALQRHRRRRDALLDGPVSKADALRVSISVASSHSATEWDCITLTWQELADRLTAHEIGPKAGSAWTAATFDGKRRVGAQARKVELAVFDCDKGQPLRLLIKCIEKQGLAAVISSSYSHQTTRLQVGTEAWDSWRKSNPHGSPETFMLGRCYLPAVAKNAQLMMGADGLTSTSDNRGKRLYYTIEHAACPKFRVIIPVRTPWSSDKGLQAYGQGLQLLAESLSIVADSSCMEPAHLYYDARHPSGTEPESMIIPGELADVWKNKAFNPVAVNGKRGRIRSDLSNDDLAAEWRQGKRDRVNMPFEVFASAVMAIPNDHNFDTHSAFLTILGGIAVETGKSQEGWELASRWVKGRLNGKNSDPSGCRDLWDGIRLPPRPNDATGASIIFLAHKCGWLPPLPFKGGYGDLDLGVAFAAACEGRFLFVSASAEWLRCDCGIWTKVDEPEMEAVAKQIARSAHETASKEFREKPNVENKSALTRAGRYVDSIDRARKIVEAGRSEPGLSVPSRADFDADPWVLGVLNGAVDLQTGKCFRPTPEHRISKQAGSAFDGNVNCPQFQDFLARVQPDIEVRRFLQRWAGYALTGEVGELKWLFCYGTGANGKTAFVNILSKLLGEYVFHADSSLLTRNKHENEAARQVAQLPGKRLISANETARGDVLDDERMKRLVSQEAINARFLNKEAFNFIPTGKLMLQGNHRPIVQDESHGFWRRMVLVHFPIHLRDDEMIRDIDKIIFQAEAPGVLNWAIKGCLEWQERGLSPPLALEEDKEDYKAESDTFGQWIEQCCEYNQNEFAYLKKAYGSYVSHHRDQGLSPMSQPSFTRTLRLKGIKKSDSKSKPKLIGLKILLDHDFEDFRS